MRQRVLLFTAAFVAGSLALAGCATKGYVRQTVDPVTTRVDQVDQKVDKETQERTAELQKTNQAVEENERDINATREIATTADTTAKGAMTRLDQTGRELNELRSVVANIDDFNPAEQAVVRFGFNRDALTDESKQELDTMATKLGDMKRYFITVHGYTDQTGNATYNAQLSRARANQVINYLVANHDVPIYRIHTVGLGSEKLIDEGKTRKAREESRRVEITIYTAKPIPAASSASN